MKKLKDYVINESALQGKLTDDDKKNFEIIANALDNITNEISDWMEKDEANEDSDTAAFAHQLSHVAGILRSEWPDEVVFKP